jgi:hypothetical protein
MAVQSRRDITNIPFIKSGTSYVRNGDIAQNAQRTEDLLPNTVMAQIAATRLWVPLTQLDQVDGSSVPRGIYLGDTIDAADIAAGNVEDVAILIGGCCTVDQQDIVWDQDILTQYSVVNPGTIEARTAMKALAETTGIFIEDTEDISHFEN